MTSHYCHYVFFANTCFSNTLIPTMPLSRTAISQMDYTKSPRSGPQDAPLGSGIHHKASRENDFWCNVMVGLGVGRETCIQDKDMNPHNCDTFPCSILLLNNVLSSTSLNMIIFHVRRIKTYRARKLSQIVHISKFLLKKAGTLFIKATNINLSNTKIDI